MLYLLHFRLLPAIAFLTQHRCLRAAYWAVSTKRHVGIHALVNFRIFGNNSAGGRCFVLASCCYSQNEKSSSGYSRTVQQNILHCFFRLFAPAHTHYCQYLRENVIVVNVPQELRTFRPVLLTGQPAGSVAGRRAQE